MNGLLQFLQAASNTAADTVAAPVDLLSMVLRKAGVPIPQAPVGGSEWMKNRGLIADVPQSGASLAGETMGLLAPVVAAAKAPQIAAGLLKMGENAAAPRALNPQTGAIVWHGSPHKFDKFDSSKIGTGEGAQAYGHGIYVAEAPDVAQSYAQSVKANSGELVKRGAAYGLPEDVASNLAAALQAGKKFDPVVDAARAMIDDPLTSVAQRQAAQRLLDNEMAAYNAWSEWSKPGNLYKVDLPDEAIARMLDWDKPLSQQSPAAHAAWERFLSSPAGRRADDSLRGALSAKRGQFAAPTGSDVYKTMHEGGILSGKPRPSAEVYASVSQQLRKQGIPGIRYLDGGSRGAGAGTSNFVVFPGEESLLRILERNGMGL